MYKQNSYKVSRKIIYVLIKFIFNLYGIKLPFRSELKANYS